METFILGNTKINLTIDTARKDLMELLNSLNEVNNLHQFIHEQPIYPEWREEIQRMEFIRAIHGTLALEGSEVNLDEVQKIVESQGSAEPSSSMREKEASNVLAAYEFIKEWSANNNSADIDESVIRQLHTIITRDCSYYLNEPGKYRNHGVSFGIPRRESEIKNEFEIQARMNDLIDFLKDKGTEKLSLALFPIAKAIVSHYLITLIHPFSDGNGRVARALEALILYHFGEFDPYCFPITAKFYYQERANYFDLLRKTDDTGDPIPFILFSIKGLLANLKIVKENMLEKITHSLIIDYVHQLRRLNKILKRQANVVEILFNLGKLELPIFWNEPAIRGVYSNVSDGTRRRDIRQLSALHLIKLEKEKKSDQKEVTTISANWDVLKDLTLRLDKIPHKT